LVWAGKKEHTSFEVPTVSLHVHERIDPRTIIEAVRKRNGMPLKPAQGYLFETREENPPLREAVDFYRLGAMLRAYGNLPRPESCFPCVFTSPEEAAEAGVCELSSVSWYGMR
jgi:hypothetical protein